MTRLLYVYFLYDLIGYHNAHLMHKEGMASAWFARNAHSVVKCFHFLGDPFCEGVQRCALCILGIANTTNRFVIIVGSLDVLEYFDEKFELGLHGRIVDGHVLSLHWYGHKIMYARGGQCMAYMYSRHINSGDQPSSGSSWVI